MAKFFEDLGKKAEQPPPPSVTHMEGWHHIVKDLVVVNYNAIKEERRLAGMSNARLIGNKLASDHAMADAYADYA